MKIDKDIPLPGNHGPDWSFTKEMEVGDSFYVECDCSAKKIASSRSAALEHMRNRGMKGVTRIENSGVRVWRIE